MATVRSYLSPSQKARYCNMLHFFLGQPEEFHNYCLRPLDGHPRVLTLRLSNRVFQAGVAISLTIIVIYRNSCDPILGHVFSDRLPDGARRSIADDSCTLQDRALTHVGLSSGR